MGNEKNSNFDIGELIKKAAQSGTDSTPTEKSVNDFIDNNLSDSQARAVKELLKDEEKTKAILNSDAAKALFKKFFGGN